MLKIVLVLCVALSLSLQGCSPSPIKNVEAQGISIVCFGDSITYGDGAKKNESYPSVLRNISGASVVNAGVSGDTTGAALKRLNKDVFPADPYLVIVELGANDFIRRIPAEKTISNLRKMVRDIQDRGAIVAIVDVSGQYDIYHDKFKRLAKEEGCLFIPRVMEGITKNSSLKADNFHPNAAGYRVIAQRVYAQIKPYIK